VEAGCRLLLEFAKSGVPELPERGEAKAPAVQPVPSPQQRSALAQAPRQVPQQRTGPVRLDTAEQTRRWALERQARLNKAKDRTSS
jgi:hypothetical protein